MNQVVEPVRAAPETSINAPGLSTGEFEQIRNYLYVETGIHLNESKRPLVAARLSKYLRYYGFGSYAEYFQFATHEDRSGAEQRRMINALTTNKTDFYRECHHFEYLRRFLEERTGTRAGNRRVRIWSAACSTGEEPYTIAMTLMETLKPIESWDVRILASDIDTDVLAQAEAGIYRAERVAPVPEVLRRKYLLRGTGNADGLYRMRDELRRLVTFRRINFMTPDWPIRSKFDAIFCRNVLIYFNRETQERLVERLVGYLNPGGLLFIGHSESLQGMAPGLRPVANTVYRLDDSAGSCSRGRGGRESAL